MKRYVSVILVMGLLLSGCSKEKKEDKEAPVLTLKEKRIQVELNSKVDYQSFIEKAMDEVDGELISVVKYNEIDTSQIGQQEITYTLKDKAGNETKQTMIVDVVKYFKNKIFSPTQVKPEIVKNPEDITVLVNKVHQLPQDWEPNDLEPIIDSKFRYLRKEANAAFTKFYKAAKAKGIEIYSVSAYRSYQKQKINWENQVKVFGEEYASLYSAYPGRSEHQLGLAIDISYKNQGDNLTEKVASSDIGKFIESDAYKYGFILRYPKDKVSITNYGYEPWHIRYVGVDLAKKLHKQGITLEEYYKEA
ncbi:MAG: M15 family metallopeptidase [Longibaculum muris]|uniref:LAS superfamily LD-carboxypeptidase LdcB n=1 Tax=Longibaculum muris TaxID=1796628 RepID=A0A4R3Z5T1_9FIRM|nr:M15 family metallopeptidase [Longibaculum muris]KXU52198.1 serine-type D-Ala-D-Ala carboxypeptidase [Candidatus Stoquefichus sp. KLE1796]MBS5369767.1 D-alanyl-D-alanine carboxypeptidase family protein [Coprobacillus cateniformis]MCR1887597.1 M15 family metallopeptidase [Longibaculum muris]MED9811866.1 M15 family metallopeptidase [Longibaculum muris]TCW00684.1 LAS superfamily LD-carboxypeptidase LdcB [Longibaculum muris]